VVTFVAVLGLCVPPVANAQTATPKTTPKTTTRSAAARARANRAAARAAAARAAAQRLEREAMTARFRRDLLGNLVPDVRAAAAIVYDPQTGEVIWEENAHAQRSVASLTKLMTVLTFMADQPDLRQLVTVTSADVRRASVTYLRAGEKITYSGLLHLTLIASDNAAARTLARTSEGGTAAFVSRMNRMAAHLGLSNTHFADPSGLDANNVSSAYDVSQLIFRVAADERLAAIMRLSRADVRTGSRVVTVRSTNKLLGTDVDVLGGKTGFISKAGYCLATLLQIPQGPQVAVVVLGATNSTFRFWEARHLFHWVVGRNQGAVGGDDTRDDEPDTEFASFAPAR
jgi:D-alanyl-D-alanine endopeptidase (penicillin-binding protein 7)